MNQLDVYYRALLNYRKLTTANHDCTALRSAIAEANAENDRITIKRAFCTIDSDWVDAIEAGLIHIEKAIKEERQFIRSNGEVVPIEKVKRVSKETTVHLARHSNLITRYEEGEDIVPDKLYMIERLNDYAVYENRFLYMLLCYLRDFVTIRYNAILDLTHKYDATIDFDKSVVSGKQKMKYTLSMQDVRRDDPYLKNNNPAREIIDRIDLILKAILAFLATPLMSEVSKVAMLKPPITKTNVLKMDNNFKGAVALYDFIILYDKPGYEVEHKEIVISPFGDELADEMAEAGSLISFLAYQYGLGMKKELKEAYLLEEERLKAEKVKERAERIEALKRRLQKTGEGIEDYVITIEKQLRALEGEAARAEALASENFELKETEKNLRQTIEELKAEIERLKIEFEEEKHRHFLEIQALNKAHEEEICALNEKHEAEINALIAGYESLINDIVGKYEGEINELVANYESRISELIENYEVLINDIVNRYEARINELVASYEAKIKELVEAYEAKINELILSYESQIRELVEEHEAQIRDLVDKHEEEIEKLQEERRIETERYEERLRLQKEKYEEQLRQQVEKHEKELNDIREQSRTELEQQRQRCDEAINKANAQMSEANEKNERYEKENSELTEAKLLADARIKALGGIDRDYTDKESFGQLEKEYLAFTRIYKEQWAKTKKRIRQKHLNLENIKGQKEKDGKSD